MRWKMPSQIPLIGVETAAHYAYELGHFLQALPMTNLSLSLNSMLSVEESICFSHKLHSALLQYPISHTLALVLYFFTYLISISSYRDTCKTKQTTISQFFKPQSPTSVQDNTTVQQCPVNNGCGKSLEMGMGNQTGLAGPVLNWELDFEAGYL